MSGRFGTEIFGLSPDTRTTLCRIPSTPDSTEGDQWVLCSRMPPPPLLRHPSGQEVSMMCSNAAGFAGPP